MSLGLASAGCWLGSDLRGTDLMKITAGVGLGLGLFLGLAASGYADITYASTAGSTNISGNWVIQNGTTDAALTGPPDGSREEFAITNNGVTGVRRFTLG